MKEPHFVGAYNTSDRTTAAIVNVFIENGQDIKGKTPNRKYGLNAIDHMAFDDNFWTAMRDSRNERYTRTIARVRAREIVNATFHFRCREMRESVCAFEVKVVAVAIYFLFVPAHSNFRCFSTFSICSATG